VAIACKIKQSFGVKAAIIHFETDVDAMGRDMFDAACSEYAHYTI
jgi:hypothetical protein